MKLKKLFLLLIGIGISNIGAWIYLIALNLIVLDMTGSPLAVSILYILPSLATILTNFWSGTLIDRLNKRKLMIFLDLSRAVLVISLPFLDSLIGIYLVVFVINMANAIFEPSSIVYMTKYIPSADRQRFNALKNFIHSVGFILGPSIAGILFVIGTPDFAIRINAIALLISAIILLFLQNVDIEKEEIISQKMSISLVVNDWIYIASYMKSNIYVTLVYMLFSFSLVFMTALDSLEASFATNVLSLSESAYGFLVSIAGIGVICGSVVNAVFADKLKLHMIIGLGACFTPIGYIVFALSDQFIWASIGFFALTFFFSFANTGFLTFFQNNVPTDSMGRFSSILGILEAIFIMLFTIIIGVASQCFEIRLVYLVGSVAFLLLGLTIHSIVTNPSKRNYYERV